MKIQRKWRRAWQKAQECLHLQHTARTATKKLLPILAVTSLLWSGMTLSVCANPTGGQITAGAGSISQSGNTTTVTQTTNKMSVNWQSFSIAGNETVNFVQPGSSSVALNRIIGNSPSSIYGHVNANGQVFLINPNGILFAPGAQVNVGGLVASTQNLTDKDFQAGSYNFSGKGGTVINQGTITAANGGYVALLGSQVSNQGVITAQQGTVALGASGATTLDFHGDGLLNFAVTQSALNAQADNKNLIQANGGQVYMTANAANTLAGTVVNNSGIIRARSLDHVNGTIILNGGPKGTVNVGGTLETAGTATGQTGGSITILGDTITTHAATLNASGELGGGSIHIGGKDTSQQAASTTIDANSTISANAITSGHGGNVTIWSAGTTDFAGTITAAGGSQAGNGGSVETSGHTLKIADTAKVSTSAPQGKAGTWLLDPTDFIIGTDISAATLGNALATSDITIQTTASPSSATAGSTTLATGSSGTNGDIIVNEAVTWNSGHTLTLNAYHDIAVNANITATTGGLTVNAAHNITATGGISVGTFTLSQGNWVQNANGGTLSNFSANDFRINGGSFLRVLGGDGTTSAYRIADVYGLQGIDASAMLGKNYVLANDIDASGTPNWNSGQGFNAIGDNARPFTGTFNGQGHTISGLTINAGSFVGLFARTSGTIQNLGLLNVNVHGAQFVGGLVGYMDGSITNSYSAGAVTGSDYVGGLVGQSGGGISNSYSIGTVTGRYGIGGLVGQNYGDISNSYSTAMVTAGGTAGGLVGNMADGSITNSYSTGTVTGINNVGGLVGLNDGSISNSYWDVSTSGIGTDGNSTGGVGVNSRPVSITGLNTAHLMSATAGPVHNSTWVSSGAWNIVDGVSYPYLTWQFGGTPQIISGTLSSGAISGQSIQAAVNGTLLAQTTTGANGFYYFAEPSNTVAAGAALLLYPTSGSAATTVVYANGGQLTNTNLTANTLTVTNEAATSQNLNTLLAQAKGSLPGSNILYNTSAGAANVTGDLVVNGLTGINGTITTTGTQTYNHAVTLGADSTLTGTTISFGNTVDGAQSLTITGNASFGGAVGAATPLSSLSVSGSSALSGSVTTSGAQTYTGNLTINTGSSTLALTGLQLHADGTLTTTGTGRWLAYVANSGKLSGSFFSSYDFSQYGYSTGPIAANTGNGLIYTDALTFTSSLSGSVSKTYNGNSNVTNLTTANYQIASVTGFTTSVLSAPATGTYADKNVNASAQLVTASGAPIISVLDANNKPVYGYGISTNMPSGTIGWITQASLSITAAAKNKIYGETDPSLTYTASGWVGSDSATLLSGSLTRVSGENVGDYAINQGSVSAGSNYNISYSGANLHISPATLAITLVAKSKTYGAADPSLTYGVTGLANGDTNSILSGSLTRAAGENVGWYRIGQGSLTAGNNYTISYTGNYLYILPGIIDTPFYTSVPVSTPALPHLIIEPSVYTNTLIGTLPTSDTRQ